MNIDQAEEQLKIISERCENRVDVEREVNSLPKKEKMEIVFALTRKDYFEDVQWWSMWLINFIDAQNLINDHETGTSRRELVTGFLRTTALLYQQSADDMTRAELQTQTQDSQYAVSLANEASMLADALNKLVSQIIQCDADYMSVLNGRKSSWHYIDGDGKGRPYPRKQLEAEQRTIAKQEHRHRQELKEARKEHTLNYWNLVPLPALRPDETPVQTIIPLWEAGFMTMEETEEEPALAGSGVGFSGLQPQHL